MQFLSITRDTKLSELAKKVGNRNVQSVLHLNNLNRTPNIGREYIRMCNEVIRDSSDVDYQRKTTILNTFVSDSDIFETAALMGSSGWKVLSNSNALPNALRIPDSITIPDSTDLLGNGKHIDKLIYYKAIDQLQNAPHYIDPSIFNSYDGRTTANIADFYSSPESGTNPMRFFKIPWGEVTLHSNLSGNMIQFPVYPEELSDSVRANYTQMPELLYQYEPWQVYNSSGPRQNSYSFNFHRDMWSGDHRDGKANELIRECMANCYPMYKGSAVYSSIVTLYVSGHALISGVMTDASVSWDGPLGLDGWYLHCKLDITITEVSPTALNYDSVRKKPLIG